MKKIVAIIMAVLMMSAMFVGCSKTNDPPANNVVNPDLNHDDIEADDKNNSQSVDKNDADETTKKPESNNGTHSSFASSADEFIENIGELVDISMYEVDEDDGYVELSLKDEYKKSFNFDYKIDIDGDSITLPVSFADMKKSAFSTEVTDNEKISNEFEFSVIYTTDDEKEFSLYTTNLNSLFDDAEKECDIKDCIFYQFGVYVYEEDADGNIVKDAETAGFDICGITGDSTVEDVLKAVKNPTYITYDADYNSIEIDYTEEIGNSNTSADISRLRVGFYAAQNCMENIKYEYAPAAVK